MNELTELDRQVLTFAGQWWKYAGAKDTAIRDQFGMSTTRYHQHLNRLINSQAAYVHDPMLVKRLRRLRERRQQQRQAKDAGRTGVQ